MVDTLNAKRRQAIQRQVAMQGHKDAFRDAVEASSLIYAAAAGPKRGSRTVLRLYALAPEDRSFGFNVSRWFGLFVSVNWWFAGACLDTSKPGRETREPVTLAACVFSVRGLFVASWPFGERYVRPPRGTRERI
jgi:hypothetical protein